MPGPSPFPVLVLYIRRNPPLTRWKESSKMGRRHFDDYEPDEWEEEHKRADRERRKRDAKRHRHNSEENNESRETRDSRPQ